MLGAFVSYSIPIPEQCSKCDGNDVVPQGDCQAVCMDCNTLFEFVAVDDPLPLRVTIPLKHVAIARINPADDQVDASPFVMTKLGKITGMSIAGQAEVLIAQPEHIVDRHGCSGKEKRDMLAANLAHDIYKSFAWAEWVLVQRTAMRFIVKIRHTYPVEIREHLHAWLKVHHFSKSGFAFQLQLQSLGDKDENDSDI